MLLVATSGSLVVFASASAKSTSEPLVATGGYLATGNARVLTARSKREAKMIEWPEWADWELELSPHLLKRMIDRSFNEADLRLMLEDATGYHENHEPGRWVLTTTHAGRAWEIIVEPLAEDMLLVVVTAYPCD